jgi:hypothetical protein
MMFFEFILISLSFRFMDTLHILQSVCHRTILGNDLNFDRKSHKIGRKIEMLADKRAENGRVLLRVIWPCRYLLLSASCYWNLITL